MKTQDFPYIAANYGESRERELVEKAIEDARPRSPYAGISDAEWREAYDSACEDIYQTEGSEREPSDKEILHALDELTEQREIQAEEDHRRGA